MNCLSKSTEYQGNFELDLAARMAHDIRSPIAVMAMSLHLIEKYNIDLSIMRAAIQRLRDIADYALDKYRDNQASPSVLLLPLLEEVMTLKRFEWSNRSYHLDFSSHSIAETIKIHGSEGEIKSMLSNLLNNAIEACDTDALIQVNVFNTSDYIELAISDNGIGIPSQKITKYVNGESSKHSGRGLGLSSAKKYMEKICGKLSLSSQTGIGTTVTLQFKAGV